MFHLKLAVIALSVWSYDDREPSDRLIPATGNTNIWGPAYVEKTKAIVWTDEMIRWQEWGDKHLKPADMIHRLGDARLAHGLYPFSKTLAKVTQSKYSHTGVVSFEDGKAFVYDATKQSIRRQPFGVYMIDLAGGWCVQRPKIKAQIDTKKAIDYVKDKWQEQVPFDYDLSPDDKALYCVELAVKSYKAGGIDLGKPTRIIQLPGILKWKMTLYVFARQGLKVLNPVWYVGNEKHGILSSPLLETPYSSETVKCPSSF